MYMHCPVMVHPQLNLEPYKAEIISLYQNDTIPSRICHRHAGAPFEANVGAIGAEIYFADEALLQKILSS